MRTSQRNRDSGLYSVLYHARDQYAVDLEVTYNSLGVGGTKIRTSTIYENSLDGLHDISS